MRPTHRPISFKVEPFNLRLAKRLTSDAELQRPTSGLKRTPPACQLLFLVIKETTHGFLEGGRAGPVAPAAYQCVELRKRLGGEACRKVLLRLCRLGHRMTATRQSSMCLGSLPGQTSAWV